MRICHDHSAICLVGGDVFHSKTPKSPANSLSLIREAIEVFGEFPGGRVYGIVGNHDIQFDRLDTLSQQPLGILIEAGVYAPIGREPLYIQTHRPEPWMVQIDGFDFAEQGATYASLRHSGERHGEATYRLGLVHASGCSGDSREFFGTTLIGYNQLRKLDYDVLLWGHDHSRTETEACGNVTHINLGSLARAALSADEVERKVSAVLMRLTPDEFKIKEVPLQVLPIEQAFRTEDKQVLEVSEGAEITKFFSSLSESVGEITSSDPLTVIETLCKNEPTVCSHIKELCSL